MSKILVTGGAGFIGSNLVDELIALGHKVSVVDNLASGVLDYVNKKAKFFEVDICDSAKLKEIFKKVKPDFVFHLAAQIDVRKSVEYPVFDNQINSVGSFNIFSLASEFGVKRVIFISTGGAIYGEVAEPATEETLVKPISPYAIHKFAAERYLAFLNETKNLDYSVLRLANVYGPRQYKGGEAGVVSIFVEYALRGKVATVNGDGLYSRDYVYVGDVVNACVLAMNSKKSGIFNIGAGTENTVLDVAKTIKKIIGKDFEYVHGPAKAGDIRRSVLDWKKVKKVLGWRPVVKLEEGIKKTIEWSKKQSK